MKLRGRVSDLINILKQKTTFDFSIYITDSEVELYTISSLNKKDIIQSLKKFAERYPQLVSHELVEALEYKVEKGALRDETANADLKRSRYDIVIYFDREEKNTTFHCCVSTTLN
ncbi:uncharacterized protein LOC118201570 [Stegodyphus dumicola]|uniref:uncharacterized protein LOC118201570 n=1 Tax=Stegodyphus dumicola TaxID=202533 RepID=UPI0015A91B58|nr:uncharacterized protein LOC118201570 [Stegodyphus dumicola]